MVRRPWFWSIRHAVEPLTQRESVPLCRNNETAGGFKAIVGGRENPHGSNEKNRRLALGTEWENSCSIGLISVPSSRTREQTARRNTAIVVCLAARRSVIIILRHCRVQGTLAAALREIPVVSARLELSHCAVPFLRDTKFRHSFLLLLRRAHNIQREQHPQNPP